jgi:hypothetical protein
MSSKDNSGSELQAFLTVPEVAKILRCSKAHAHKLINGEVKGTLPLPAIAFGRRRVVSRSVLEAWSLQMKLRLPVAASDEQRQTGTLLNIGNSARTLVRGEQDTGLTIRIAAETAQSILDIAERSGLPLTDILHQAVETSRSRGDNVELPRPSKVAA